MGIEYLGQLVADTQEDRRSLALASDPAATFIPEPHKWVVDVAADGWRNRWKTIIWYEWKNVSTYDGKHVRISIRYEDLKSKGQAFPHNPRFSANILNCRASVAFFQSFADSFCLANTYGACDFLGVCFEGDPPAFSLELPRNGIDLMATPFCWKTAKGKIHSWTLDDLERQPSQVFKMAVDYEDYMEIGLLQGGWICLGALTSDAYAEIHGSTYAEKLWEQYPFQDFLPATETKSCYWLLPSDRDDKATVKFLSRSLAQLLLNFGEAPNRRSNASWESAMRT